LEEQTHGAKTRARCH